MLGVVVLLRIRAPGVPTGMFFTPPRLGGLFVMQIVSFSDQMEMVTNLQTNVVGGEQPNLRRVGALPEHRVVQP